MNDTSVWSFMTRMDVKMINLISTCTDIKALSHTHKARSLRTHFHVSFPISAQVRSL